MWAWPKQLQLNETLARVHLFYQLQEMSRVCGMQCGKKRRNHFLTFSSQLRETSGTEDVSVVDYLLMTGQDDVESG